MLSLAFRCTVCILKSGLVEWNVRNVDDGIEGDLALLMAIYSQRPEMECTVVEWEPVLYKKKLVILLFSNLFNIIYILKLILSISQ